MREPGENQLREETQGKTKSEIEGWDCGRTAMDGQHRGSCKGHRQLEETCAWHQHFTHPGEVAKEK
ncbi:hypothetical protein E2C01_040061 [Portunus trituberculatus]|uniref:Uncharacterized protein n=1 Tax=Portunus trituberculatus TaxID=210409 RepID=A0A5B7FMK6_PORTR|nr:hypothetical protein [Portunus trituberculatus]